ncbi:MAG: glycoside hydrolase family 16 protein [Candidatus Acidiferrales bacterium]
MRYIHPQFGSFLRWMLALAMGLFAVTGTAGAQCAGVTASVAGNVTWTPIFCQEFNGAQGPPDTTVWAYDLGNRGWNNEIEIYCGPPGYAGNPTSCPSTFSTATNTSYIDGGGHLVIQAIQSDGTWTSARMKTQGLENFEYGRIEASIQLPDTSVQGLWPAFWTLGTSVDHGVRWPTCGEADIMEDWFPPIHNGTGTTGNRSTIHTTVSSHNGTGGRFTFPAGESTLAFHTYGVIWSANMMQFYVDDPAKPFFIITPSDLSPSDTWPFNAPEFLLMNIAVGGTLGGTPSMSTPNPGKMLVDYVRQYKASAVPAPNLGTPPSIAVTAGATTGNTSTFAPAPPPDLPPGSVWYSYINCNTNAPAASCSISTTDPLDHFVITPGEGITVTFHSTAGASGTTAGSYTITVNAFTESNATGTPDATATIHVTVN